MLTTSNPICKEIDTRLVREKENPRGVFGDPVGNVAKSRECGCEMCSLVCRMLDESEKEQANAKVATEEAHRDVKVEFSGAGMSVQGLEIFVTDREFIYFLSVEI